MDRALVEARAAIAAYDASGGVDSTDEYVGYLVAVIRNLVVAIEGAAGR